MVAIAFEMVSADRDSDGVHTTACESTGLGKCENVGSIIASCAQHDRRLGKLMLPIPVLSVNQAAGSSCGR